MKYIGIFLILIYKRMISPSLGVTCIYVPTCSMYTLDAIKKYGFFAGCAKGFCRIMRCTPFHKGGFDPVPENYRGKLKWIL